eukprot:gene11652-24406_t
MFNFSNHATFTSDRRRSYDPRYADFRHNPYVGTFVNGSRMSRSNGRNHFLPNSSPHVGTFRHSPCSVAPRGGLKDILWEEDSWVTPFLSQLKIAKKNRYSDRHVNPNDLANGSIYQHSPILCDTDHPCCAICLDAFIDGDEIRVLDCEHCFHKSCVDTWLLGTLSDEATYTSVCPTCRRSVNSINSPTSLSAAITDYTNTDIHPSTQIETEDNIIQSNVDSYYHDNGSISFNTFVEIGALLHSAEGCCRSPSNASASNKSSSSSSSSSSLSSSENDAVTPPSSTSLPLLPVPLPLLPQQTTMTRGSTAACLSPIIALD